MAEINKISSQKQARRIKKLCAGQVMLLSVLLIGSSILIFSAISGYLMAQRIRLSTDFVDSTRAIFAAEAGLECQLYNLNFADPSNPRTANCAEPLYGGTMKTSASTSVYASGPSSTVVRSAGVSNNSRRALLFIFDTP